MTTTILPSRRPYGPPSYAPSSRPVYYGGASAVADYPTAAEIAAIYTALSAGGDFYDTHDTAQMGGVPNGDEIQSIAGYRASISLAPRTLTLPSPHFDFAYGGLQFHNTGVEQVLDPQSTLGQLQDAFYICAEGIWLDGFFRLVCVSASGANPVLFDIRIGEAGVSNPGGVSALVQNAQANIANIAGITAPTLGARFLVSMKREAGANATLKIDGQSATVTKGASTGTDEATVRYAENYAPTGTDFFLGRSVFIKGAVPTADQEATIEAWVAATYTAPAVPTGKAKFGSKGANITFSNNDLTATAGIAAWQSTGLSASGKSTGKHTAVFSIGTGTNWMVGLANASYNTANYLGADGNSIGYNSDGNKYVNNIPTAFGATFRTGYKIKVEYDADADTAKFYQFINGAWAQQGGTVDTSGLGNVFPAVAVYGSGAATINTGQYDYDVTAGYAAGWTA